MTSTIATERSLLTSQTPVTKRDPMWGACVSNYVGELAWRKVPQLRMAIWWHRERCIGRTLPKTMTPLKAETERECERGGKPRASLAVLLSARIKVSREKRWMRKIRFAVKPLKCTSSPCVGRVRRFSAAVFHCWS